MKVTNKARRFGSAQKYVVCRIGGKRGLATPKEAETLIARAKANPEDYPPVIERARAWLCGVVGR